MATATCKNGPKYNCPAEVFSSGSGINLFQLPNSRWGATKNQMISVPVTQDKIQETMSQLPRVPKDAYLFPVELKRKMEYKNNHKQAFIDPEKTLRVVQMLKTFGHPDYQFYEDLNIDSYKNRCKEQDENGYNLLFDNESDSDGEKMGWKMHQKVKKKRQKIQLKVVNPN